MKHDRIIAAAHAPNCTCPRCRGWRAQFVAFFRGRDVTPLCLAIAAIAAAIIPARAMLALLSWVVGA